MIFVIEHSGGAPRPGLCNHMWAIAPLIAFAKEHGISVYVLNFDRWSDFFCLSNSARIHFVRHRFSFVQSTLIYFSRLMLKLLRRLDRHVNVKRFRIYLPKTINRNNYFSLLPRKNFISSIWPWELFTSHGPESQISKLLIKHADQVRDIFTPNKEIVARVENVFLEQRKHFDTIVGVHIRKGDYETWLDGKYFYEDEVYQRQMKNIESQLTAKGCSKVGFFLCSNSELQLSNFSELSLIHPNLGQDIADLHALSSCDYIIGPPSTFSSWASFYGKVPMKHIYRSEEVLTLEEFSAVLGLRGSEKTM